MSPVNLNFAVTRMQKVWKETSINQETVMSMFLRQQSGFTAIRIHIFPLLVNNLNHQRHDFPFDLLEHTS